MAAGSSIRLVLNRVWIAGAERTPLHGRPQPGARSSPCPPPPAAGCAPSPWPPQPGCVGRHGQSAIGHDGDEFVLEPRWFAGTSWCMCYKVDASPEEATSSGEECCIQLRSCTRARRSCNRLPGELQPATGGAATMHAGEECLLEPANHFATTVLGFVTTGVL